MQYSVYLKSQQVSVDAPAHETTRRWASLIVSAGWAAPVGQNAIQLKTVDAWESVKARFRPKRIGQQPTPQLLPALDHYVNYIYPLSYEFLRRYSRRTA